jgi:hypothetical protein
MPADGQQGASHRVEASRTQVDVKWSLTMEQYHLTSLYSMRWSSLLLPLCASPMRVMSTRRGRAADFRNRANEICPEGLECRRRAGQTDAAGAWTIDRMHSRRKRVLKTQRTRSSFSRDAKNCLTRYVRNYSVRSACGPRGKPIRAESCGTHLSWKHDASETT